MEGIDEKELIDYPKPVFMEGMEIILNQMKRYICKICMNDGTKGTGFFCKIPLINEQELLNVFITNNHIINEDFLKNEKNEIIVKLDNDKIVKKIKLKNKLYHTNKEYDITIIEIKKDIDEINDFLELDNNILVDPGIGYIGNSIYILHYPSYPNGQKAAVSYGIIKNRFIDKEYNFIHFCNTEYGSSGSPILCLTNNKVIGIHKQRGNDNLNYNIGVFLYQMILEYLKKYQNQKEIKKTNIKIKKNDKNDENDEITLRYKNDNGYYIKLFGNNFVDNNKDKCKIVYSGKEKELCTFLYDIPKDNNGLFEIKLQGIKKITNIDFMFNGCTQLVSSPDISKIQISGHQKCIFCGCLSLQLLPDISHWKEQIL